MKEFAAWLSTTPPSVFIQQHNAWTVPLIHSIHIIGITMVMGSVLMMDLRVLGWAGTDQTLQQTTRRFGPWLTGSLWLMLTTGLLMIIGEPPRELMAFSFWVKMVLLAIGTLVAIAFQRSLRRHEQQWEATFVRRPAVRGLAIGTLLLWASIVVMGRLIAYDHVWGTWSAATSH